MLLEGVGASGEAIASARAPRQPRKAVIAVLILRFRGEPPTEGELARVRGELPPALGLGPDDFYHDGPLIPIRSPDEGPIPIRDGSSWIHVNLWVGYYASGYRRGNPELLVRCADWLESRFPGSEIWYGHDADDASMTCFGPAERAQFLAEARARA